MHRSVVEPAIRRENRAAGGGGVDGQASEITDATASFADEKRTSTQIPTLEATFPKEIEAAARHIRARSRPAGAETAYTARAHINAAKRGMIVIGREQAVTGKSGRSHSVGKSLCRRDRDRLPVEPRARTTHRNKRLIAHRIENHTELGHEASWRAALHADQDTEVGNSMGEIASTVERVDDPAIGALAARAA